MLLRRGLCPALVHKHGPGEISKPSPNGFRQVHVERNRRESVATKADLIPLRQGVFSLSHTAQINPFFEEGK